MKAYKASLLNSLTLIVCGIWGFYSVAEPVSLTPFIPAIIGIFLLGMNDGVKNENKTIAHIAVLLTLLSFANIMPLMGQINPEDNTEKDWMAIFRIVLMLLTSLIAMITFIQSFINARKA
tara:strand:+ start:1603 stop:1962 length:360 start_codon:yes stop_codon:yes gene_type:complete